MTEGLQKDILKNVTRHSGHDDFIGSMTAKWIQSYNAVAAWIPQIKALPNIKLAFIAFVV